jgi:hypothetical protein
MSKLQQIVRKNGSVTHSVNIPLEVIEEVKWEKGDELIVETVIEEKQVSVMIKKE